MISEEKMGHILHLMLDGIWKADMIDYPQEEEAFREAKKVCLAYINQLNSVTDAARKRILSQKNPPMENTPQWEVLYQKYFEEESNKRGG